MFFKRKKQQEISDQELILKYRQTQDLEVLATLFERYSGLIYATCYKYLKDQEDSKDMTMNLFEKLQKQLLKNIPENFGSWVHVVAKNSCLMKLRSDSRHQSESIENFLDPDMENQRFLHPDNDEENKEEEIHKMLSALNELPDEQKICIELFYLEEKSYKEIEEQTGFDYNQVKSFIQNGKRKLKILTIRNNE